MDKQELKKFIDETMIDRKAPYKRERIAALSIGTKTYIESKLDIKIKEIDIDKHGVIHAMKKVEHNLEPDDLLYAVEVINTSNDITISDKKHKQNIVLNFKKDMGGGELTILTEVHAKDGYLLVFDAWRQKKARKGATANMPSANAQNEFPRADTSLSP
jgi:hypothetical protein